MQTIVQELIIRVAKVATFDYLVYVEGNEPGDENERNNMTSIAISKYFGSKAKAKAIEIRGEGDGRITIWQSECGKQAIETNGEAILDTSSDWSEALKMFTND